MDTNLQERWVIRRIGLLNFWLYDEEIFDFCDGRLLLRGANGSGKSVTMQSFIPLLLDGNKSPERLDPFQSKSRRLENYLLGENEDIEENTGYLYMEFEKPESGLSRTVGMGLRARKGKALDFWGFCIKDGRRIGADIFLYRNAGEKIPYTKSELKNRLGDGGELYDGQGDYMAMVNRLLFGYENIEDYDALIKLLVQLRTPKLSKEFRPTVVYEILNNALQPLSDDDLRPMSEAMENMDNIAARMEMLKESLKAASRIREDYDRYNRFVLLEKARDFIDRSKTHAQKAAGLQALQEELVQLQSELAQEEAAYISLTERQQAMDHLRQELEAHDAFKARKEADALEVEMKEQEDIIKAKTIEMDRKKGLLLKQETENKTLKESVDRLGKALADRLEGMEDPAELMGYDAHEFLRAELLASLDKPRDFRADIQELDRYREKLRNALAALEAQHEADREYDRSLKERDQSIRTRDEARRELERAELLLSETCTETSEKILHWEETNHLLKMSSEELTRTLQAVNTYGDTGSYDDVRQPSQECRNAVQQRLSEEMGTRRSLRGDYQKQAAELKSELENWRSRKDPEPPLSENAARFRERLDRAGIPFVPLYRAVDFLPAAGIPFRRKLEEALDEMGLLNALVIPEQYRKLAFEWAEAEGDRVIVPAPHVLSHDLTQYLKAEDLSQHGIPQGVIEDILRSILLTADADSVGVAENGEYRTGLIRGAAAGQQEPRYIGAEARRRYRDEILTQLEMQLQVLRDQVEAVDVALRSLEAEAALLKEEADRFPKRDDLETARGAVIENKSRTDAREKDVNDRSLFSEKAHKLLVAAREAAHACLAGLYLPANREAYAVSVKAAEVYRDTLLQLEADFNRRLMTIDRVASNQERLQELMNDCDELRGDIAVFERKQREHHGKLENLREVLKAADVEGLQEKMDECIKELAELPRRVEAAVVKKTTLKNRLETGAVRHSEGLDEAEKLQAAAAFARETFRIEWQMGNVYGIGEELPEGALAARVVDEIRPERSDWDRNRYGEAVQKCFHSVVQHLTDYTPSIRYPFDSVQMPDANPEQWAFRRRFELTARINGREADFRTLHAFLEEGIDESARLLKESDRQLFEDILANTVGQKIKNRIRASELWVQKMNALMGSMNTSSGLALNLAWRSREAENEEQLGTKELVDILKTDVQLLDEVRRERLTGHFRSKIAEAQKTLENKGETRTFFSVIRDVLDYRRWFEFRLFYTKTGEPRRELTNNAFFRFSGGEKAMAMYVPLFAAVYARYEGGRVDCPRILSLDEAFAGVDETNIRDMFRLLEDLKLSFIINSQSLWGDYDTLPALSICELSRPNNADFVTVLRYRWNGKRRVLVAGTGAPGESS